MADVLDDVVNQMSTVVNRNVGQDGSGLDIEYSRQPFFNASFEAKHHKTTRKHATFGPEIVQKTHLNYGHHLQSKPLTRLQTGNSATLV